jgi:hypothetical protein
VGRLASFLAVAAVGAVAVAAGLDAFRGGEVRVPGDLQGELVYSDGSCHRHAIRLPDLARHDFLTIGCGVFTRQDNLGVRNGSVSWFAYPVPGGATTLLRRRDLPAGVSVEAVAWLRDTRFAAVLQPRREVTVWERGRQVAESGRGAFTELRPSPAGGYFAALGGSRVAVFDRDGRLVWHAAGHAIAWSPDERYAAVAGNERLAVVAAGTGRTLAQLPIAARDVDWRLP